MKKYRESQTAVKWILNHSKLTRYQIAARIGITRQSLYKREISPHPVLKRELESLCEAADYLYDDIPLELRKQEHDQLLGKRVSKPLQRPVSARPNGSRDKKGQSIPLPIDKRQTQPAPLKTRLNSIEPAPMFNHEGDEMV